MNKELIEQVRSEKKPKPGNDFFQWLVDAIIPNVVQVTCIWALEKAYYDGWTTALPGAPQYREFVERWTTDAFNDYVDGLENAVNNALAAASKKDRAEAEVYFLWIARYEKDFWDMALSGE